MVIYDESMPDWLFDLAKSSIFILCKHLFNLKYSGDIKSTIDYQELQGQIEWLTLCNYFLFGGKRQSS